MPFSAGTAFLQVVPSFQGIEKALGKEAEKLGKEVDAALSKAIPEGMEKGSKEAKKSGERAGSEYAGAFADQLQRRLGAATKAVGTVKLKADASELDKAIHAAGKDLKDIAEQHGKFQIDDKTALHAIDEIGTRFRKLRDDIEAGGNPDHAPQFMNLSEAISQVDALRDVVETARRHGRDAGEAYGGAFATNARKQLEAGLKAMPDIRLDADTSPADRAVQALRSQMEELHSMTFRPDLDAGEFLAKLRYVEAQVDDFAKDNPDIAVQYNFAEALAAMRKFAQEEAPKAGKDAGENFGGAFARDARKTIDETLHNLPDVPLDIDDSPANRKVQELRARLEVLREFTFAPDMDGGAVLAEIRLIETELDDLERHSPTIDLKYNFDEARGTLKKFAEEDAPQAGDDAGDRYAGHFADTVSNKLTEASRSFGDLEIGVNAGPAELEIQALQQELDSLSSKRIGVNIDEGDALAKVQALHERLSQLARDGATVEIRANAAQAAAQLELILALGNRVDGQNLRMKVDVDGAAAALTLRELAENAGVSMSRLQSLIAVGASLGTVIVPAAAAAATAIGFIGQMAGAAAIGIGVGVLGFMGISDGVKALHTANQQAAKSGASLEKSENRVAGALDSVQSAERSLGNTRANIASQEQKSIRQIADARAAAGTAAQRAAQQTADAERTVARAQQDEVRSRRDLARAIEDARRQREDETFSLRSNALAQRQAALDIADAKKQLDKVLTNPRSTQAEREQALVTFEQRKLQLEELSTQEQRLQQDRIKDGQEGLNQSKQVQTAQERVQASVEATAAAQRRLAETQQTSAQQVAEAQQRVADAIAQQAEQQRQGQFQLEQGQQAVISAQRQVEQAMISSSVAGGAALTNLRNAMESLSPAGQRFVRFIENQFRPVWDGLKASAQEGMLPGVQAGLDSILDGLRSLNPFISSVGRALGGIFLDFLAEMRTPTWKEFFGFLKDTAVPSLWLMWDVGKNLARGLAALLMALTPFNDDIGSGLLKFSEGFASWAEKLSTSTGYQKFIDYVSANGPKVVEFFREIWNFAVKFVIAAAPIGAIVLTVLEKLFEWINKIPTDVLTVLIGALAAIAVALGAVALVTAIVTAGTASLIVLLVGAFLAAWTVAYMKIKWFHDYVDFFFHAFATLATWLWQNILKPVFSAIAWAIENVVIPVFMFLWNHVLRPFLQFWQVTFSIIGAIFQVFWGVIQIGAKIIGWWFSWLYGVAIKPIMDRLRPLFEFLGLIWEEFVVPKFKWGVEQIGKFWDWLVEMAKKPIKILVNTVLNEGILKGYNKVANAFGVKPDDVHIDLPAGFRRGGEIDGPGTETSDSILIRASKGEHMWTAEEVDAIGGHSAMYRLRQAVKAGWLPGFARGGAIGGPRGDGIGIGEWFVKLKHKADDIIAGVKDLMSNPAGALKRMADKLIGLVPGADTQFGKAVIGMPSKVVGWLVDKVKNVFTSAAPPGGGGPVGPGGLGWQKQMDILRAVFPGLPLYSGYRPGDITASGHKSWHSVGRAVDVPPRPEIYYWIRDHFPQSRELISLIDPDSNIKNGARYRYSASLLQQHGTAGMPNAHIHWAMDSGGLLQPGWNPPIWNGTSKPEPVLTAPQWRKMTAVADKATAGGDTLNFDFSHMQLDETQLNTIQQRKDALNRVDRPNR